MPKPRSSVWDLFRKHPDGLSVFCTLCKNTFAHPTNSTGNLRRHLTGKHGGMPAALFAAEALRSKYARQLNTWSEADTETAEAVLALAFQDDAAAAMMALDAAAEEEVVATTTDDYHCPDGATGDPEREVEIATTFIESEAAGGNPNRQLKPQKGSRITWQFYVADRGGRLATCMLCHKKYTFKTNNSTSNLHRHLQLKHPEQLAAAQAVKMSGAEPSAIQAAVTEMSKIEYVSPPSARKSVRPRSVIWQYFERLADPLKARCRLCSIVLLIPNTTSGALTHLRMKHAHVLRGNGETIAADSPHMDETQGSMEEAAPVEEPPNGSSAPNKTECGRAAVVSQPTVPPPPTKRAVGNVHDSRLMHLLRNVLTGTEPPSLAPFRTANARQHLSAKWAEVRERVQRTLDGADHVALTLATTELVVLADAAADAAAAAADAVNKLSSTTTGTVVYMAVSAHCVTRSDWRLHSQLLSCVPVDSLDAHSVQVYLSELCAEWRIAAKVFAFVAVQGGGEEEVEEEEDWLAGLDVAMGWLRLQCVEERLGRCIAEAMFFNEFEFVRLKVKLIEEVFEGDAGAAALTKFRHFQREHLGQTRDQLLPALQLADTDWRRTLDKLRSLCALQAPLDATLELLRLPNRLSTGDWMCIRDMRVQLGWLAEAIGDLRSRRTVSASKVCVILHGLDAQLETHQLSEFRGETSKQFAAQLQRTLQQRFATDVECDLQLTVCSLLDPRFRRYGFVQQHSLEICRVHVESLAGQVAPVVSASASAAAGTAAAAEADGTETGAAEAAMSVWSWLDGQVAAERHNESGTSLAQHEVQLYLNNLHIDRSADPLLWWRTHGSLTFPRLALVARKYLALPASCAVSRTALEHVERWLGAGEASRPVAWQIDGTTAPQLAFLMENIDYFE